MNAPPQKSHQADGVTSVDWQEYNSRWDRIWSDGVQPGQVNAPFKSASLPIKCACSIAQ